MNTALDLSTSIANHGEQLSNLVSTFQHDIPRLKKELRAWRLSVASELETNCNRAMKKKMPALASKLRAMEEFPNVYDLLDYAIPVTSDDIGLLSRPLRRPFDIARLAEACEFYFPFGVQWTTLLEKFVRSAPAAFIMDALVGNFHGKRTSRAMVEPVILKKREEPSRLGFPEFKCALPTGEIAREIKASVCGVRERRSPNHAVGVRVSAEPRASGSKDGSAPKKKVVDVSKFVAWIPAPVLYQVMGEAVDDFNASTHQLKKRPQKKKSNGKANGGCKVESYPFQCQCVVPYDWCD